MRHLDRRTVEVIVGDTAARLDALAARPDVEQNERDILAVLRRHLDKIGQFELAEKVDDFLIGYTKPIAANPA